MLRIVIALVLVAHGIGHSMGLLQVLRVAAVNPQWDGGSWVLGGVLGGTAVQAIGSVLWISAMVGFSALGGVVIGWLPVSWWQALGVGSAVASLAGLLIFPLAFPPVSTIGALIVDVVVLAAATWADWSPSDLTV